MPTNCAYLALVCSTISSGRVGGAVSEVGSQLAANQLRTICLSKLSVRLPDCQADLDQYLLESGVRTSSPSVIWPLFGFNPNSNFVSAKISPAASASSDAVVKIHRLSFFSASAFSWPTSSTTFSKLMFSSFSPSCALYAGVKIGSGSLSPSLSPSGSFTPQISPVAR